MYAIIENGGKQYKVQEGDVVFLKQTAGEEGTSVTFDKVLAVSDGDKMNFGAPFVKNATVTRQILSHGKDKKIISFQI